MTTTETGPEVEVGEELTLEGLGRCYEGAVPAVVCTADADGTPNITYISRVHIVDHERLALSNQFMSKTSRNLVVNPVASLLLIDPLTYEEYHLMLVYERTERRGPVFERLRDDVDELAEQMGLRDVFRLRAADIFRVRSIERVGRHHVPPPADSEPPVRDLAALAEFAALVDRAGDLDGLLDVVLDGFDRVLGYHHVCLLLLDETGTRAFTIASRGFDTENLGSEIALGEGPIGTALAQCEVRRTTGLRALAKYSRTIQQSFEADGRRGAPELPMPSLLDADVRIVAPLRSLGQLIGGIIVEHRVAGSLSAEDAHVVGAATTMIAGALEQARHLTGPEDGTERETSTPAATVAAGGDASVVRCFEVDGSVFVDGEYLIKGVAGRILRALVAEHVATGRTEFTNRELRLDRTLDLPGFKDNLESRLVLLKRRLDERQAPCRIERTGRGRFHLEVSTPLRLDLVDEPPA
jgi:adenylate cyclase